MPRPNLCTDLNGGCLLRDDRVDSAFLANLLVQLMAGDDLPPLIHGQPRLKPERHCLQCAQRVMRDLAPLPTVEQWEEEVRHGHRFHRRHRSLGATRLSRAMPWVPFR